MTIVGPRPERPSIAAEYEETMPEFRLRLQVKAGLTGYAQVYGKYNTTPYDKAFDELPYNNKVCFTHKKYPQYKSTYYIHGSEDEKYLKSMMDYVHQWWIKRYYDQFDFVDWLNQGGCNWKGKE